MRRVFPLVTLLASLPFLVQPAFAAPKTIKVGYWRLEPHIIPKDGGAPTGAAIDYFKKFVAPEMGVEVEYVGPLSLPRLQSSLEDGTLDAAVLLAKNPERAAKFIFPSQSFNEMVSSVVVLNESNLKSVSAAKDLYGVTLGTGDGAFMHPALRDEKLKIDKTAGTDWLPTCFKKLEAKRVDAVYNADRASSVYEIKLLNMTSKFRVIEVPNTTVGMYTVFSKKSGDLASSYDAALKKVKAKTTYDAMLAPYLK